MAQTKGKIEKLVFAEDDIKLEELNQLLEKFSIVPLNISMGSASDDPNKPELAIIQGRYNEAQLDILEDVFINDWTANECIQKKTHFIYGKHPRLVYALKIDLRTEQETRMALDTINGNEKYVLVKNDIDKICYDNDLYGFLVDATNSCFAYGRAVIQIVREAVSLEPVPSNENNRTIPGGLIGFKLLDSKRLGRIKVDKKSKRVVAVEYLDIKKVVGGVETEATDDDRFLPIGDLIYLVNKNGNVSTNAQFTGVSILESIVHISQVKRIIMNKNVKEAAISHYAGVTFAKFPADTDGSVISAWIADLAKAAGRVFAHKQNVEVTHEKVDTDLDKYSALVELLDSAIIRAVGLPRSIMGYEQYSNYANLEQVLVAWAAGELEFWRNWIKDTLQKYLFGPLFALKIGSVESVTVANQSQSQGYAQDLYQETEQTQQPQQNVPAQPQPKPRQINPDDVKITYEFQNISFLTTKEIIEGLQMLKNMGVPLTIEMILRIAGYGEWVEQIMQNKLIEDKKQAEEKKQQLEVMRQNAQAQNNNNPFQRTSQEGEAEDKLLNVAISNAEKVNLEKLKVLKLLKEKIERLA